MVHDRFQPQLCSDWLLLQAAAAGQDLASRPSEHSIQVLIDASRVLLCHPATHIFNLHIQGPGQCSGPSPRQNVAHLVSTVLFSRRGPVGGTNSSSDVGQL